MRPHRLLRLAVASAAALLALSACGSSRIVHDQQAFTFHGTRLTIDDPQSDLRLVPGSGSGIEVQRWLSGTAAQPGHASWTLRGQTLRLDISCSGLVFSCGSRYQVAVPADLPVTVHSSAGDDTVSGLAGSVIIDDDSGQVRVSGTSGPLKISTGSGNITASGLRSPTVRATSGQGDADIGFAAAPRAAEVRCGTGNATARVPAAGHRYRVLVTTGTGTARSAVPDDRQSASTVRVSSANGNATVLSAA